MLGFFSNTNIPAYLWSNGVVGDTKRDAVRRAMTGLYDLGVMPNYVVLNPFDAEDIELAKDDHGQYIMGMSYTNQNGQMMLWNVRVILCGLLKRGDFLVGDFNQAPVYYNEEMTLRVAEQHADFFVKNMVVMLAEQLEVLIVEQPQAFRRGSFNEAPQAG
jgi:HK97 family phage major capsid protein